MCYCMVPLLSCVCNFAVHVRTSSLHVMTLKHCRQRTKQWKEISKNIYRRSVCTHACMQLSTDNVYIVLHYTYSIMFFDVCHCYMQSTAEVLYSIIQCGAALQHCHCINY
jgi:hypothetical protein